MTSWTTSIIMEPQHYRNHFEIEVVFRRVQNYEATSKSELFFGPPASSLKCSCVFLEFHGTPALCNPLRNRTASSIRQPFRNRHGFMDLRHHNSASAYYFEIKLVFCTFDIILELQQNVLEIKVALWTSSITMEPRQHKATSKSKWHFEIAVALWTANITMEPQLRCDQADT